MIITVVIILTQLVGVLFSFLFYTLGLDIAVIIIVVTVIIIVVIILT